MPTEEHNLRLDNAMPGIRPPKPLAFNTDNMAINWKLWIQQFDWYSTATQLNTKLPEIQAATFMSAIGPEAITIFNNFNLSEGDRMNFTVIRREFEKYFTPKLNVPFERYTFFKTVQKEGESFEDFLTTIKTQAKTCDFGQLHDSLIRDKVVIGVRSDTVREKLLTEANLTLEKAIEICKSNELATKQLQEIKGQETSQINVVKNKASSEEFQCRRCGKQHKRRSCPAYKHKCENCNRMGHFESACWEKKTQKVKPQKVNVVETETSEDEMYVNAVLTKNEDEQWYEVITINNTKIQLALDTGAQCNVLPKFIVKKLKIPMQESATKRLVGFTEHKLDVIGEVTVKGQVKNKKALITFKVVNEKVSPILGRKTCQELELIKRINKLSKEFMEQDIFKGLGCLKNYEYDIDLIENPKFDLKPPRRIPHKLRLQVKNELDAMVKLGVIKQTTKPTPVVSPMVIVRKKGKLRICIDPTDLNKNILRRHYPMNTIEEIATRVNESKFFTLLDCRRGFWQIKVTQRTQEYLTFATPRGRYSCLRLPFGLSSAPEVYQSIMVQILQGISNVECSMDDVLIHAENKVQLETITKQVLRKMEDAGLKLNKEKCVFNTNNVKFLGHIFTSEGLQIDPEKTEAIEKLKTPENKKQLQRLLGMVTYLNKFIPNMSELTEPLRKLLQKENAWLWTNEQDEALKKIKNVLTRPPVLKYYEANKEVKLTVDASSKSIGAVLLQDDQPVAYATKALTKTQQTYPQIEKEALAVRYACQKFHQYIYGQKLIIETDHKPLESIFKKTLQNAPARLQRLLFDVLPYSPVIIYKKGTDIPIADALSRDCENKEPKEEEELEIQIVLSMSTEAREGIAEATKNDEELTELIRIIKKGWPNDKQKLHNSIQHYFNFRDELSIYNGIIFKANKVVVPNSLIPKMLKKHTQWTSRYTKLFKKSSSTTILERTSKRHRRLHKKLQNL